MAGYIFALLVQVIADDRIYRTSREIEAALGRRNSVLKVKNAQIGSDSLRRNY